MAAQMRGRGMTVETVRGTGHTVFRDDHAGFMDTVVGWLRGRRDRYHRLTTRTEDPLHNVVEAGPDYRVLQAWQVIDPNGNLAQAAFDALGMVVGTAVMGKDLDGDGLPDEGDSLAAFRAGLTVPVDDEMLKKIADLSGGEAFTASSLEQLKEVFSSLQQQIGYETIKGDASVGWLRVGALVLALAALGSLLINRRLPN